jgi:hypothetical protein
MTDAETLALVKLLESYANAQLEHVKIILDLIEEMQETISWNITTPENDD